VNQNDVGGSYSNERLIWWILGLTVSMTGVLGLLILNSVTSRLHDLNADMSIIKSRVTMVEGVVTGVNTLNAEQRQMASKVALIESLAASANNLSEYQREMDRRLVTIENLISERTDRTRISPQSAH
jgi:prefoldin subunit 5